MPRFFVPPEQIHGERFTLTGSEAHHALHVLRVQSGDRIEIFDGRDSSFVGLVDRVAEDRLEGTLKASAERRIQTISPIRITLVQSLIKGPKWDWLVEKASEIGVTALWPLAAARSVVKGGADPEGEKQSRWARIALSASKQCGRSDILTIRTPQTLVDILGQVPDGALSIIAWEKEDALSIKAACRSFAGHDIFLFIGPEGGWEAHEVDLAQKAKVVPVRLGATMLRAETAGLVAATLVLGELGSYA